MQVRLSFINAILLVCLTVLVGCTTAQNSIFRQYDLDSGKSLTTDATQRVIINTKTHPSSRPGRVNPERIVCAEPSPDVASIVANSFGFGLNILGQGNAAVSSGQASALAQLAERTVTVQLLRDQMYRACEAYANGAISGTEYSLLMSRNNDAMVTLMLGESASRIVGRQLAAIGGASGTEASAEMQNIIKMAQDAVEAQQDASEASEDATEAEAEEDSANEEVQNKTTEDSAAAVENAEENAEEASEDASEKKDEAEQKQEEADEKLEELLEAVSESTAGFSGVGGGFANGPPALNEYAVSVAEQLTEMQEQYLNQSADEHFISACVVELGNSGKQYSDYNEYGGEFKYSAGKDVAFSRRDYTPLQNQLIGYLTVGIESGELEADAANFALANKTDEEVQDFFDERSADVRDGRDETQIAGARDADALLGLLQPDERRQLTDLFFEEMLERVEKIESVGGGFPDVTLLAKLDTAFDDELDKNWWADLFDNEQKHTDRIMRAALAIEDRERASFLAKACMLRFSDDAFWDDQHELSKIRAFMDFVEDVETIRNGTSKPVSASTTKSDESKKSVAKTPDIAQMYIDYIKCDEETENPKAEACRVGVIGKYYSEQVSPKPKEQKTNSPAKDPKSGSHVVQLTSEASEAALKPAWDAIVASSPAIVEGKSTYNVSSGDGDNKVYGLRVGPFGSESEAKKFCSDSGRPAGKCQVISVK